MVSDGDKEDLQPLSSEEFMDMEDDGESNSESSPHSSNEASSTSPSQVTALPVGLQLASRGAGSAPSRIDPLEIRFSQMKMRHLFGDGRRLADTVLEVREEKCSQAERAEYGVDYKLIFPFPQIEVIRWKCKLRDAKTGRPKVDKNTGEDVYDSEDHWFTLDNRRLYCLQEAAMRVWPQRCVAEVALIISGPHAHMRELRKFRTLDRGCSAMIGSRADGVLFVRWSWREKAGLDESDDSDSEAELLPEVRLPPGSKPQKAKDQSVFDHLASLEPDDYERIELSKKLSWILRHGAWNSSGRCNNIKISDDGWVLSTDLLQCESLKGVSLSRLMEVVTESNKQKFRYDTRSSKDGMLIRASGRKGRKDKGEKTRDVPATSGGAKGGKAGSKGAEAKGSGAKDNSKEKVNGQAPAKEKVNGQAPEKAQGGKPPGVLEAAAGKEKDKDKESRMGSKEDAKAAAEAKKKAQTKATPKGGDDLTAKMGAWLQQMAAIRGARPPGPLPPHSPAAHAQFMQEMQAMQQMMHAGAMQQMHVRRLMMKQFQAVQAFQNMQAMQAMNTLQYMQAMHEMQAFYDGMEWDEDGEEIEDEEEEEEAKVPETAQELEAKIQQILAGTKMRQSSTEAKSSFVDTGYQNMASASLEADVDPVDLEAKIAEALQAAAARNATQELYNGVAKATQEAAKAKPSELAKAKPPPKPTPANIEANFAKALEEAKNREAAQATSMAQTTQPVKSRPTPKKKAADPSDSIEDKIAKALEAAKERRASA